MPSGHAGPWIHPSTVGELGGWISERLGFLRHRDAIIDGPVTWAAIAGGELPARVSLRPDVSWTIPQEQKSDSSPTEIQEQLFARVAALPGVTSRQSAISVPGARGFMVDPAAGGPLDAFLVPSVGEFAHLHPGYDGSLHLALPPALARDAVAKG